MSGARSPPRERVTRCTRTHRHIYAGRRRGVAYSMDHCCPPQRIEQMIDDAATLLPLRFV